MKKNLLLSVLLLIAGHIYGNQSAECSGDKNSCDKCLPTEAIEKSPFERLKEMTSEQAEREMEERWANARTVAALRKNSEFAEFCSVRESLRANLQAEINLLLECHKNDNCSQLIDQWKNIGIERLQMSQRGHTLLTTLNNLGYDSRTVLATAEIHKVQKK